MVFDYFHLGLGSRFISWIWDEHEEQVFIFLLKKIMKLDLRSFLKKFRLHFPSWLFFLINLNADVAFKKC